MSRHRWAVGSTLAIGMAAAYPIALIVLPAPEILSATIDGTRSFQIAEQVAPQLAPHSLLDRIATSTTPPDRASGIHLLSYTVDHSHRWQQEVTVPRLIGPLLEETHSVCGTTVHIGSKLFDTRGPGAGLREMLQGKVAQQFPMTRNHELIGAVTFPALSSLDLGFVFNDNSVLAATLIALEDGTKIAVKVQLGLNVEAGKLVVARLEQPEVNWSGPVPDDIQERGANLGLATGGAMGGLAGCALGPLGCFVGAMIGAGAGSDVGRETARRESTKALRTEVASAIDSALGRLGLADQQKSIAVPGTDGKAQVQIASFRDPIITATGITLPLCTRIVLAQSRQDESLRGWPDVPSDGRTTPCPAAGESSPIVQVDFDGAALSQLLFLLWQSGTLRELGTSPVLLESLPASIRDLAFDVTGFDPGLPPTLSAAQERGDASSIALAFGDVRLGTWGSRTVVGHALADIFAYPAGNRITLGGRIRNVFINCAELEANSKVRFTPCLSDLMPAVRDSVVAQEYRKDIIASELVDRLPALITEELSLVFSAPEAQTTGKPTRVTLRANGRLDYHGR